MASCSTPLVPCFSKSARIPSSDKSSLREFFQSCRDTLTRRFTTCFDVSLDGEFAPGVETAGGKIDRSDDRTLFVSKQHLAMQFQVLQHVNPCADVVHDAEPSDRLDELVLL